MLSNIKVKPPSIKNTLKEYRIIFELLSSYKHICLLKNMPKGNKEPVLIIPGFMASDSLTIILRTFLKLLNYRGN